MNERMAALKKTSSGGELEVRTRTIEMAPKIRWMF